MNTHYNRTISADMFQKLSWELLHTFLCKYGTIKTPNPIPNAQYIIIYTFQLEYHEHIPQLCHNPASNFGQKRANTHINIDTGSDEQNQ